MFGLGYPELFVIGLVALVVIGPRRLPELMRQAGRFSAQLRRAANEFRHELELAADQEKGPGDQKKNPSPGPLVSNANDEERETNVRPEEKP